MQQVDKLQEEVLEQLYVQIHQIDVLQLLVQGQRVHHILVEQEVELLQLWYMHNI